MNALTGTRALIGLALRLDRVRLTVWVLGLAVMPMATAANYFKLYPKQSDLDAVSGVLANPSLVAVSGPLFANNIGALTAWKIGVTEFVLVALMSLLTVVRHTRTEEETGRLELIGSTVVGRYAPLTAALAVAGLADIVIGVLAALGLMSTGLATAGAMAFGFATTLVGLLFAALAATTAQLTQGARAAIGIAGAVLGGAYLLRAVGDTGPTELTWVSPLGWALHLRPYAGERWWIAVLFAAFAVLFTTVAYALVARRDVGAGLLAERLGPAEAVPSLSNPFALAWRLHRGLLLGWLVATALTGAVLGGAAAGIGDLESPNQEMTDVLTRMGGSKGIADAFLTAIFGIIGLVTAAYTVQSALRLRQEESSGRVEALLATPVGRLRWAASHLVFTLVGTTLLLAAAGVAGGLSYGAQVHDVGGEFGRVLGAALVQAPAAWVLAGLGVALIGLAPRLSALSWAALIVSALLFMLGALFGLSQWVIDANPFAHVPKLPGSDFAMTPMLWLAGIAVALGAAGLAGLRRRDIPVA
ncbi:ABC transporter permease [Paractinoplanes brasiliensis]|uniref:ABC-2 type transport system permease protein n=1 Tax=Paractinoplanes brasiliensis TaxID=52695 RepID=A0A4R6JD06_9ACTN|nr:ABC transporter permease [Actinoplanes brasiliensis]TDO32425.1 ABC-2 type transport system permease protein [Actinoplanes brasiliensis]GID27703.1 tetronasin ABC transporter integral membrane protein [Actinoplanes brasiliensis]